MLCEGLRIGPSFFDADDATLNGDYFWKVVEIVIAGVPTVLDVRFMYLFMSLATVLLEGSISTNMFDPMRHPVDRRNVTVGIQLLGIIHPMADIIP